MKVDIIEHEMVKELFGLMEKAGFESILHLIPTEQDSKTFIDALLINLRTLNAKYDKNEAFAQIRSLMERYNIQPDQLIENHGIA